MVAEDQGFDEQDRRLRGTETSIAAGVSSFLGRSGGTVRVIDKGSAEWERYAQQLRDRLAETDKLTETLRRGLSGIGHGPVLQAQQAAVDALADAEAEHAQLVEAGENGPVTVVSFRRKDGELVVVGGGSTFPPTPVAGPVAVSGPSAFTALPVGARADAPVPSGEEAGYVAQYALASIAAQETLSLSHQVSPVPWHGPRALESRRLIGLDGQTRGIKAPTWPAADVRHIAEQVTLRQADGRHPFPNVQTHQVGRSGFRRWATDLKSWIDNGGTIEVYDHSDPVQRDAAGLAMLTLVGDAGALAVLPIPEQSGVRTMVAMTDGRARGLITTGRNANGDLHVLRYMSTYDRGAARAVELMMTEAAVRTGGSVSFSPAGAIEYTGDTETEIRAADAANWASQIRINLLQLDRSTSERMTELLTALDVPALSPLDPTELAASVQRFREAGGDVLYLSPSDPRFVALQEQASETLWAAAASPDGTVPPGADSLWRVLNPPAPDHEINRHGDDDRRVAVALVDGMPVAAAAIRDTGYRYELGTLAAAPGAEDALAAAVVEGVHQRAYSQAPLVMFRPEAEARSEQLAAYGLEVTGVRALDDDSRVEVRLPDTVRNSIVDADRATGWANSRLLDLAAMGIEDFRKANEHGTVRRLDHSVEAERVAAEEVVSAVLANPGTRPSELPIPPVNGNRVTVVAQSENHGPAYITFDETPAGGFEVVDVNAKRLDYAARDVARYWLSDRLAESGQDAVLHERIGENERRRGTWGAGESRYFVTGMRNRLGDRPAELLHQAPESTPAAEAPGERKAPGEGKAPGQGEAPRRPGPDGRRKGPMER
ncbi:hypothetical protein GCM10009804_59730 [Kribbella hippodromi]|uniref:Uncharacterized protein n=1 Tax=Kribbella hippodromi TaxID=434347 RepID=A0ABN2E4X1_9ACTN